MYEIYLLLIYYGGDLEVWKNKQNTNIHICDHNISAKCILIKSQVTSTKNVFFKAMIVILCKLTADGFWQ